MIIWFKFIVECYNNGGGDRGIKKWVVVFFNLKNKSTDVFGGL